MQEAFFDPDVLVDWDTVDTVRLFRKVCERKKAFSLAAGDEADSSAADPSRAPRVAASHSPTTHGSRQAAASREPTTVVASVEPSTTAFEEGNPAPGFEGLTVLPAAEEISWGSGKKRRGAAAAAGTAREAAAAKSTGQPTRQEKKPSVIPDVKATGDCPPGGVVHAEDEEEEGGEGEWRCSICLGLPIAPRVTKCGHGPFCLVCILRHLKWEESARCPLCFDKMHR